MKLEVSPAKRADLGKAARRSSVPAFCGWTAGALAMAMVVLAYRLAFVLAHDFSLFVDEAQYWLWSQSWDWGYYSKPPMIAWLIGVSTQICGNSEVCIKLPALLGYPLASIGVYLAARQLDRPAVGVLAAALFLSMPGQALAGWVSSPDAWLFAAWAFSLWLALRLLQSGRWIDAMSLGLVIGVGMLCKYSMGVFLIGAVGLVVGLAPKAARRMRHQLLFAAAVGILVLSPNIAWNLAHEFETLKHTSSLARLDQAGWHVTQLGEFVAAQWLIFGPLAFPWLVSALLSRRYPSPILQGFISPYLIAIASLALISHANANWAAASYVAGAVLVATRLSTPWRPRWIAAVLLSNVMLSVVVMHSRDIQQWWNPDHAGERDLFTRVTGWRELGRSIQPWVNDRGKPIIVSAERDLLAQLSYYLSPRPYPVRAIDDSASISNHYELETRRVGLPDEAVWVGYSKAPDFLLQRYRSVELIARIDNGLVGASRREVWLYAIDGLLSNEELGAVW